MSFVNIGSIEILIHFESDASKHQHDHPVQCFRLELRIFLLSTGKKTERNTSSILKLWAYIFGLFYI